MANTHDLAKSCVCILTCMFPYSLQTDSFLEISKLQKDGLFTLVHRTDVVYNSINPR